MKTNFLTIATMLALSTPAFADSVNGNVQDHYKTVIDQAPYIVEICKDVNVSNGPGPNDTGGAILGGLIGGVLGNQFGKGDGKTAMTILGAILGADTANRNAGQKRVEQVTVCDTVYVNQSGNVVNEYDIIYEVNGQYITSRVNSAQGERARVGRSQSFRVTYQPVN